MKRPIISFVGWASVAMIAVCAGTVSAQAQSAPAPTAPSAPPPPPLNNPNLDQVYLNVRNGNLRAQAPLGGPYARAMAFVRCAGGSVKAEPILTADFGSQQESRLVDQTVRRNLRCGGTAAGIPVFLLRAAMSEAVAKDNKASDGAMKPSNGTATAEAGIDPSIAPSLDAALRVARCQVNADRSAAHNVLMTPLGSSAEKSAEDQLFSTASQCAGRDASATLDSIAYRAAIASVLGRDAASARAGSK